MTHEAIQLKLFALYDGPLTEKDRKLVESHLPGCPECQRAIAEWKALSAKLFPSTTLSEASEDFFVTKAMDRVRSASLESGKISWNLTLRWLVPLVGSAAMAAWVFFAVLGDSAELSSSPTVQTAFSSDSSYPASTGNGLVLASYSSSDEIVP